MQYNEIYNICQPVIDWLKEHYPHNYKIVIDTNSAEMIECGKLIALDKNLKSDMTNSKNNDSEVSVNE